MNLPKYFVLDGLRAFTTNIKPSVITFTKQINLRSLGPIDIVSISPPEPPYSFIPSMQKKNFPVYKSNLQKCIRRRLSDNAVRTAYAMMSCDLPNFLRRLPIIILEDVLPHPCIIVLTWFAMACSKGYLLSCKQVGYILGIVYSMCEIEFYHPYSSKDKLIFNWELPENISPVMANLLWALEFRKAYGGMKCDTEMINYLQGLYLDKFGEIKDYLNSIKINRINLNSLEKCDKQDIILEGIDYHCYGWLPSKLVDAFPEYSEYEIKGAIWFHRSRINKRKPILGSPKPAPNNLKSVYENIEDELNNWCKWIHNKLISTYY